MVPDFMPNTKMVARLGRATDSPGAIGLEQRTEEIYELWMFAFENAFVDRDEPADLSSHRINPGGRTVRPE
jgi:hypothetical protein